MIIKTKVYICTSGTYDENIDLITTNLKEAFDYCDSDLTNKLIDIIECEATIDTFHFTRPERPKK